MITWPIWVNGVDVKVEEVIPVADDGMWWLSLSADNGIFQRSDNDFKLRITIDSAANDADAFANSHLIFTNLALDKLRQAIAIGLQIMLANGMVSQEDVTWHAGKE